MLQAALPCLHFTAGPTECHLIGGTNADLAPPIDYIQKVTNHMIIKICVVVFNSYQVFLPIASKFGVNFECHVIKRWAVMVCLVVVLTCD